MTTSRLRTEPKVGDAVGLVGNGSAFGTPNVPRRAKRVLVEEITAKSWGVFYQVPGNDYRYTKRVPRPGTRLAEKSVVSLVELDDPEYVSLMTAQRYLDAGLDAVLVPVEVLRGVLGYLVCHAPIGVGDKRGAGQAVFACGTCQSCILSQHIADAVQRRTA